MTDDIKSEEILKIIKESISKSIESKVGKESNKFITKDIVDYPQCMFLKNYLIGHDGYIAGGCFKNIINGEKIKDIDIFFRYEADQVKAKMYFSGLKEYIKAYNNDRVDAFRNTNTDIVVELVKTKFAEPKDMIDGFDFTITKMALFEDKKEDSSEYKLIYHKNFFEDLVMKRIIIDCKTLDMPLGTFNRALRYTKYGYTMCRNSKLFLMNQILNFANIRNVKEFSLEDFTRELYDGLD